MAEPAAVTDTHPLVFHAAGGKRLGRQATHHFQACERQQALLYVPVTVMWEMSILVRIGRIHLRRPVRDFFADLFSNPAYQPLDLTGKEGQEYLIMGPLNGAKQVIRLSERSKKIYAIRVLRKVDPPKVETSEQL